MLQTAYPAFQNTLQQALQTSAKNAAYSAVVAMWGDNPADETDKIAENFANEFSSLFAQNLAPLFTTALQTLLAQATVTGSPVGLATVTGPVTGAVVPETLKII